MQTDFLQDFTEVDHNVTRHVPDELGRADWTAMVMHYLGMDHIGHKTGPNGPSMLPKQQEMDGIVKQVYEAIEKEPHHARTLLVLVGDHGMNAGGNHGGSGPGETEPALLFASPKFKRVEKKRLYACPTTPKEGTEFHFYTKVEQSDIVPTLAGLMGMPISRNNLGVVLPELLGAWPRHRAVSLLYENARQMLHVVRTKYGGEKFDAMVEHHRQGGGGGERPEDMLDLGTPDRLASKWAHALDAEFRSGDGGDTERTVFDFLHLTQEAMSNTASSYNVSRMIAGTGLASAALLSSLLAMAHLWPPQTSGAFLTAAVALYAATMFASSYVEEEQHFWYWITPVWIALLTSRRILSYTSVQELVRVGSAAVSLWACHRFAMRWNQTGQKHTGEPDVVHGFFPRHHFFMWVLVLATYVVNGVLLHKRSFAAMLSTEIAAISTTALVLLGAVFRLNFTQADAPELVQGLAFQLRAWSEPVGLLMQARAVFGLSAVAAVVVVVLAFRHARVGGGSSGAREQVTLAERLHHLLTVFLMAQTRAPNVPLFLILEVQRIAFSILLRKKRPLSPADTSLSVQVAITALLSSHVSYFCMGGSNSISSIDLSNAYNGVSDYNIVAVGLLLFTSNWSAAIWWCSAAVLLLQQRAEDATLASGTESPAPSSSRRSWVDRERAELRNQAALTTKREPQTAHVVVDSRGWDAWAVYITCMTAFVAASLVAVMAACTVLRTHLFIWTVFSPKYLYAMAWTVGWHVAVNMGLGTGLYGLAGVR